MWTEYGLSLVLARVTDLRQIVSGGSGYKATVEPIATIAGSFDSSAQKELKISFLAGNDILLEIHRVPSKASFILVVLRHGDVFNQNCTFMRDGSPLVVLDDGLADPWIIAQQSISNGFELTPPRTISGVRLRSRSSRKRPTKPVRNKGSGGGKIPAPCPPISRPSQSLNARDAGSG